MSKVYICLSAHISIHLLIIFISHFFPKMIENCIPLNFFFQFAGLEVIERISEMKKALKNISKQNS